MRQTEIHPSKSQFCFLFETMQITLLHRVNEEYEKENKGMISTKQQFSFLVPALYTAYYRGFYGVICMCKAGELHFI